MGLSTYLYKRNGKDKLELDELGTHERRREQGSTIELSLDGSDLFVYF